MAETDNQQREFNLRDYWQILVRRRWLVYSCVLVATVTAGVASFMATPLYKATAQIALERKGVRLLSQSLTSAEPTWLDYQNWYNTQYQIMASESVAKIAAQKLNLLETGLPGSEEKESNAFTEMLANLKAKVMATLRPAEPEGTRPIEEPDPYLPYTKFLRGGLLVEPVRESHLVNIAFVHPDSVFAAKAANALAESYRDFSLSTKLRIAKDSEGFFIQQIGELRKEIATLEFELQEYAARNEIVTGDANEVSLQDLQDLRNRRIQARTELAAARAKYQTLLNAPAESIPEVRMNSTVQTMSADISRLEGEYAEQREQFGEGFPDVRNKLGELNRRKESLQEKIQEVARQIRDEAKSDYQRAQKNVEELDKLYAETEQRVSRLQRAFVAYESKRAEVERKRLTLDELLDRKNQMELSARLGDTAQNVRLIDPARPPMHTFKPRWKVNIALGLLFGLFLGVAAAFLIEYVDNTIKSPEDVRAVLGVPVLGLIPAYSGADGGSDRKQKRAGARRRGAGANDPGLISANSPLSPVAEAYRELRTAVLLATPGHPPRDLTVTSCQPGEGKTTTAVNIATTLAQLGKSVLLVDTDLRRPRCHQVLRVPVSRGVSSYLTGMGDATGLVQPTSIERVSLVPAGPIPPNPAELLDSERFVELVEELRANPAFDHVIFDSPPVLSVVDPLLIGRHTEGTIVVVRSAYTTREAGRIGLEKIRGGRIRHLLGVVLNAVELDHAPYQYRYYRKGYRQDDEPTTSAKAAGRKIAAGGGDEA